MDDHLLDFVELMDAIKAGGVLAGSAGFAAETGGEGAIALGQFILI